MRSLKIAFVTPEAVPFVKTGGLADISGALPSLLAEMGHSVKMILPLYRQIKKGFPDLVPLKIEIDCSVGDKVYRGEIFVLRDKKTALEILFVRNDYFFDRVEPYRDASSGKDYIDNDERFIFFNRMVLETFKKINWPPDIIHANDWQSSLIPGYLKTIYRDDEFFVNCRSVMTIHNMAYQGQFPAAAFAKIGVEQKLFAPTGPYEYWGKVNFLKSGIVFADHITTVSPTYAREIQTTSEYGMGLEGVIHARAENLSGILNGVDYDIWSPKNDRTIPFRYLPANLSGKKRDKLELLSKAGLPLRVEDPLVAMISRLDSQKGFDLIEESIADIMSLPLQFILLGTGDKRYHDFFKSAEAKYPDKFKAFLGFDNSLAHLIEAGADIFLMPSRYEPCGLNQMYSLKYGTVPIVRKTGGLADTVVDFDEKTLNGTGFVFEKYESDEMLGTIRRATVFFDKKRVWHKIVKQGMAEDFSWGRSARQYEELYFRIIANTA